MLLKLTPSGLLTRNQILVFKSEAGECASVLIQFLNSGYKEWLNISVCLFMCQLKKALSNQICIEFNFWPIKIINTSYLEISSFVRYDNSIRSVPRTCQGVTINVNELIIILHLTMSLTFNEAFICDAINVWGFALQPIIIIYLFKSRLFAPSSSYALILLPWYVALVRFYDHVKNDGDGSWVVSLTKSLFIPPEMPTSSIALLLLNLRQFWLSST